MRSSASPRTLERLRVQPGYQGVWVLATPEGKGLLMSLWETQAQAAVEGDHNFYERGARPVRDALPFGAGT